MTLPIRRGTNISHWLSQSDRRGPERRAWFTRDDVRLIADLGFDHIRLPIDEEQMWAEDGRQESEAFDLLDAALDWAEQAGLAVVVDLHILRCHSFGQADEPALFSNPAESEKLADLWRQLSDRLRARATGRVGYELMNEAVAKNPDDWNRVALRAHRAVREREPERTILLGSNEWNSVFTFDKLQVPDDPFTVLTFHYYHPMFITHHRAGWSPEGRMYDGPIQYPGQPIAPENLHRVVPPQADRLRALNLAELNKAYDRDVMLADFAKPLAVSQRTGRPLYCGEFGVINKVPQPIRAAWYRDIISAFEENGIGWANWDYKGQFGIVTAKKESTGIAEVMLAGGMTA
jgi:endoglucanase